MYQKTCDPAPELFERVKLLDHGYMEFVEHWGSDERIVEAARMSTGKGFLGWGECECEMCNGRGKVAQNIQVWDSPPSVERTIVFEQLGVFGGLSHGEMRDVACFLCNGKGRLRGDQWLLRYLWSNKHATPFEMAGMTLVTQAPIMVFREWHRHRTQSYNEMSARYTPLPPFDYLPTAERCMMVVTKNRQSGQAIGADELTHEKALKWLEIMAGYYELGESVYQYGLGIGIPKELARLAVTVGRYSRMMASTDLRNWLAFLTLRMEQGAQWEIRQYANQVGVYIKSLFPKTWSLFVEGREIASK